MCMLIACSSQRVHPFGTCTPAGVDLMFLLFTPLPMTADYLTLTLWHFPVFWLLLVPTHQLIHTGGISRHTRKARVGSIATRRGGATRCCGASTPQDKSAFSGTSQYVIVCGQHLHFASSNIFIIMDSLHMAARSLPSPMIKLSYNQGRHLNNSAFHQDPFSERESPVLTLLRGGLTNNRFRHAQTRSLLSVY